jgi:hypothetical protein
MISLAASSSRFLWRKHSGALLCCASSSSSPQPPRAKKQSEDVWNYNVVSFDDIPDVNHVNFPHVTANDLEGHDEPPRKVKMLLRDFIEDSLYNPNYGYFPKQATIVTSAERNFDFPSLRDSVEFQEEVGRRYEAYGRDTLDGPGRQLWHTPTELFKVISYLWLSRTGKADNFCW